MKQYWAKILLFEKKKTMRRSENILFGAIVTAMMCGTILSVNICQAEGESYDTALEISV